MIGLDTTAIIDFFRGNERIKAFLQSNREPLAATTLSYAELFFGLNPQDQKHALEGNYYREFFNKMYHINLTPEACEEAAKMFWELKKEGKEISQFDCMIAASFLIMGVRKILTANVKHFERIKKMQVVRY
ncbi:type II toxin-antitoxin system VapC family toxin [Candidatus Woesearchaeota archaeon]|nr:type II toxin-antitoxin system VapC family toxin [Candidatus Woesearchaeota archaeon]